MALGETEGVFVVVVSCQSGAGGDFFGVVGRDEVNDALELFGGDADIDPVVIENKGLVEGKNAGLLIAAVADVKEAADADSGEGRV